MLPPNNRIVYLRFCRETGIADSLSYAAVPGISIFGHIVISFKGRHHQQDVILQCVRWYVAYSLSYRAVDKQGQTIDFLLTAKRDKKAARRFLNKAIRSNGKPRSARATFAGIELWRMLKNFRDRTRL